MSSERAAVVTPWKSEKRRDEFLRRWNLIEFGPPDWLILQHDARGDGCGAMKNNGVAEAVRRGYDIVVVLDDDCYPVVDVGINALCLFVEEHLAALQPQPVNVFEVVTHPPSRGTPYKSLEATMPVAASMGFWKDCGDYDAVRQLAHHGWEMEYYPQAVFGRWFPLCGMNLAFRPRDWLPWCQFIEVPRFDDIWMGWLWQKEAYRRGYCFNLNGPVVSHGRHSDVWTNLVEEARHLERSETLWQDIATSNAHAYETLRELLPV